MPNLSPAELELVRQLLHDSVLEEAVWDRSLATFAIRFKCLRRNIDGSDLEDRVVEFKLFDVAVVAIGYESSSLEARPSQFEQPQRISAEDLTAWPFRPQEATLWINSEIIEDAIASARVEWYDGTASTLRDAPCTFCLHFDQWADFGMPIVNVRLVVGGESFTITSGGVPLDLQDWKRQFEAWWEAWTKHWVAQPRDEAEIESSEFDSAIPAGPPEPPNLSYKPPSEAVFALEPTDTPVEIVQPIRDWFESHHERDWLRMARIYPCPDRSMKEQADVLQKQNLVHDFGRWEYARSIDSWWIEAARACVVVRGIEHVMPLDGDPEENREAVWTFALRKRRGEWNIDRSSQGWPVFGSAQKLADEQKPWLKRWASGSLRTQKSQHNE